MLGNKPLIHSRMTMAENTEEGFLANEAGYLSPGQIARLHHDIGQSQSNWFLISPPLLTILAAVLFVCGPLTLAQLLSNAQSLIVPLELIAGVVAGMFFVYQAYVMRYQAMRRALQTGDFRYHTYTGPAEFISIPSSKRWQAAHRHHDAFFIRADDHLIPVAQSLWDGLRPAADGLIIHYLTHPFLSLLSIQPIPAEEPPTDSELAKVIGIGDDGELIYEEEDKHLGHRRAE